MNLLAVLLVTAQIESAATPEPPPRSARPISTRVDGGYAPRKLFSLPVTGADFGAGLAAAPFRGAAFGGSARAFVGSTEHGLRVWDARVLGEAEVIAFDRLHLGAGLGLFVLGVHRAARDETMLSWGPHAQAFVRVDVVRADQFALFVRAAFGAGLEIYDQSVFVGPTLGGGFELDVAGTHAR